MPEPLFMLSSAVLGLLLPLAAIGITVYLAVRLAIRHEHRNRPDR